MAILAFGAEPQLPAPAPDIIKENVSGGCEGIQPFPGSATDGSADGAVDTAELLSCTPGIADVQGSYSVNAQEAFGGQWIDGYGPAGEGYRLPDQSLGANRNGYRGMADEPLPVRPPSPDSDDDYDHDQY